MTTPSRGGGAGLGIGCALVAVVALLIMGGGVASFFMLRRAEPPTISIATATPPLMPTSTHTAKAASAAPLLTFGESGNGAGQLSDARAIAVDMDENVYVADYDTLRVQKFDPTGKFQWIVEVPKDEIAGNKSIWGLAVDSKNILWVNRDAALFKYTLDGKPAGQVKGNYDDKCFKFVALDAVGNIATLHDSAGNTDLLLLDPSGKIRKRVKNVPEHGLAMDGAGNVYMSDEFGHSIEVIDPEGAIKSKFGSKKDPHLNGVGALAVDGKGHIFAETSEGLNVFDQGGAYLKTIDTKSIHGAVRSFAISTKGHLFILGNDKVNELELGTIP